MNRETEELKRKARALQEQNEEILRRCDRERRNPTEHEYARMQATGREFDFLIEEIKHSFDEPPIDAKRSQDDDPSPEIRASGGPTRLGADRSWQAVCRSAGVPIDTGGFKSSSEFFAAVAGGRHDPRLMRATVGQTESPDSTGGFSVPTAYASEILNESLENEIVRGLARVYPMRTAQLQIPAWDGADHTNSSLFGGITASWADEASELDLKTAKLRRVDLQPKKLSFIGSASSELVEDSPSFSRDFSTALATAAGWHLDSHFLGSAGTGAGRPLSVLNSSALVTVSKESSGNSGNILYRNLTKMFGRLLPSSRQRAVWVVNNSCIPNLLELFASDGTSSAHVPVMSQDASGRFTILSRPVYFTEKTPTLGTKGDVLLCDFSQYAVALRTNVDLAISPHVLFTQDSLTFRLRVRVDGQPLMNKPVQPADGGDTLSAFVCVETRT